MQKLLAVLLSIMLVLPMMMIPTSASATAAKGIMDNYIVQKIFDNPESSLTLLEFGESVVEQGVVYTKYNGIPSSEAQTFVEAYEGDTIGRINAQNICMLH